MIGNDIVDLAKAKQESNIFRPRYLEKVCSSEEIDLVVSNSNSINLFWRIWTMKESAYKAFQRQLKFKPVFNPFAFTCQLVDSEFGKVSYQGQKISIKTIQTKNFVYSEVMSSEAKQNFFGSTSAFLLNIKALRNLQSIPELSKTKEHLPELKLAFGTIPFSKTHHGKYQVFQY